MTCQIAELCVPITISLYWHLNQLNTDPDQVLISCVNICPQNPSCPLTLSVNPFQPAAFGQDHWKLFFPSERLSLKYVYSFGYILSISLKLCLKYCHKYFWSVSLGLLLKYFFRAPFEVFLWCYIWSISLVICHVHMDVRPATPRSMSFEKVKQRFV